MGQVMFIMNRRELIKWRVDLFLGLNDELNYSKGDK